MTDKMRKEFEAWWSATMNIEEMDLWRCEYPFTKEENQPYACHETQRSWMAWKASRESLTVCLPDSDDYSCDECAYQVIKACGFELGRLGIKSE